ncbi:MAG: carbohydrate ABC transporter permease [Bacilli bacterium]
MKLNKFTIRNKTRKTLLFFAYISPWLLGFIAFTIIPLFLSLVYSFTDVSMVSVTDGYNFIGFSNYIYIFTKDEDFLQAIYNTFIYAFCKVAVLTILALLIALLLNVKFIGRKIFRVMIYLPAIIPVVSVSLLWKLLFSGGEFNTINFFLSYLGLQPVNFLGDNISAMGTIIFVGVWSGLGPTMLVFLAAIQNVNKDLLEAASLDGAGPIRKFQKVVMPAIMPVMFFVVLTGLINALQTYAEVKLLTGGGPGNATITMSMVIVSNAFKTTGRKQLGYACAQGWIVFLLSLFLTMVYIWNMNRNQKGNR